MGNPLDEKIEYCNCQVSYPGGIFPPLVKLKRISKDADGFAGRCGYYGGWHFLWEGHGHTINHYPGDEQVWPKFRKAILEDKPVTGVPLFVGTF